MSSDKEQRETMKGGSERQESLKESSSKETSSSTPSSQQTSKSQQTYTQIDLTPLSKIWKDLEQNIMEREQSPKFPIGLSELDRVMWGLHKKELLTIGARTSMGKSAMAIFMAKQIVEKMGQRVVYFSLEMSKEQILERLFTNICKVNNLDLRRGKARGPVIAQKRIFEDWIAGANLLIDDKYGFSYESTMKVCDIIQPDFIVVDYIQMVSAKGFRSKLDAIEEYVRMLKQLSIQMNFGVILLSQLNRMGGENGNMNNFKHAGVLEEHSDTCLTLKWDYSREDKGKYIVNIEKQRHGEVENGIEIDFIPQYSDFKNRDRHDY